MLEIVGEIVEMGRLQALYEDGPIGVVLKTKEGAFITISGLTVGDVQQMPNVLYKQVRITISLIPELKT